MHAIAHAPNHPLAWRMAGIAFLANNIAIGFMFGSFGVLLGAVEAKMAVGRSASSLGVPLAMLGMALMGPVVGALCTRVSMRLLMIAGAALSAAGYALLAFAPNIMVILMAYGLLIGPGLSLVGTITPATLVTRWFNTGRGRALGIVNMPLVLVSVPLICVVVLREHGLAATYLMLAAGMTLLILPLLFVRDFPPNAVEASGEGIAAVADPGLTVPALLRRPRIWAVAVAAASISTGGTLLVTHLASMAAGWGLDTMEGASLMSIMAIAGVAGSLIFGWLADKVGGGWALAINCTGQALLWMLLLLHPSFLVLGVVIGLIGVHGAGITAILGMALVEQGGATNFGRAYGISNLINLPFVTAGVPIGAWFFVQTGSYAGALVAQIMFFGVGALLAMTTRRRSTGPAIPFRQSRHPRIADTAAVDT